VPDAEKTQQPDEKPDPGASKPDGDEELNEAGKRALERERAERKRLTAALAEASEKAKRLDELEESSKSEVQKAAERAAALEKQLNDTAASLLKIQAALDTGLPHTMADRLRGSTKEELEEDAKTLMEALKIRPGQARTSDAGATGDAPTDINAQIRRMAGRAS
jgi:seryl-tRNA synthetase